MKQNLTEIVFLLDRSGSMNIMGTEPVDGYNNFIKEQQDPTLGAANISFTLFNDRIAPMYESVDINTVEHFSRAAYTANGMTSLRDVIGQSITNTGARLAALPEDERPDKVLFVILTDGEDTSSVEYSTEAIANMIKEQTEKYSWTFQFMGTTAEAIASARSFNFSAKSTFAFANTQAGLQGAYASASASMRSMRSGDSVSV